MIFTLDYFRNECTQFWKMCGETKWSSEQLDSALRGLAFCLMNLTGLSEDEQEMAGRWFEAVAENHARRLAHRLLV